MSQDYERKPCRRSELQDPHTAHLWRWQGVIYRCLGYGY